jgi:hypothetical protein
MVHNHYSLCAGNFTTQDLVGVLSFSSILGFNSGEKEHCCLLGCDIHVSYLVTSVSGKLQPYSLCYTLKMAADLSEKLETTYENKRPCGLLLLTLSVSRL